MTDNKTSKFLRVEISTTGERIARSIVERLKMVSEIHFSDDYDEEDKKYSLDLIKFDCFNTHSKVEFETEYSENHTENKKKILMLLNNEFKNEFYSIKFLIEL